MFTIGFKKTVTFTILSVLVLTGCGKETVYHTGYSGYTQVDAIKGCSYEIPANMMETATAVTELTGGHDYSSGTYLYKNGTDAYVMFNIRSFVIAAAAGTSFRFDGEDSAESHLANCSLNGIWFSEDEKPEFTQNNSNGCKKSIMNVVADVSITEDLFGTFSGQLAVINTGSNEYSIFIGSKGENFKSVSAEEKRVIKNIARSLEATDRNCTETTEATEADAEETYGPELPKQETDEKSGVTITKHDRRDNIDIISPDTEENQVTNPDIMSDETEEEETLNAGVEEDETLNAGVEEDDVRIIEDASAASEPDTNLNEEYKKPEIEPDLSVQTVSDVLVTSVIRAAGNESDLYHQLEVGKEGQLDALITKGETQKAYIKIDQIYTGVDAINLMGQIRRVEPRFMSLEAPAGTSFHVARYSLSEEPTNAFVDIKLNGISGEKLRYLGISYSSRTYQTFAGEHYQNDMYTNLYCVYIVPNGCIEYTLTCDCGILDKSAEKAYYHVVLP